MNRTRASSLDAFGLRDQRNRIFPALEASDGSTLSLDFTQMSSLDSRFTFTRSSTATFINSSGLVQYADHNLAVNSTWTDSNSVPTGWTMFNGATPNAVVTIPETGKRSITVTSGVQSFMYQAQTLPAGLAQTLSLVVHSVSGTGPTVGNLLTINGAVAAPGNANILYYKDGVSVGAGGANTEVTPGTWSMVFSGGTQIRLLQGSGTAGTTYTIVVSGPQLQSGVSLLPKPVPNSSTSTAYQAPRFDYNPTTLTPRGLLMEGTATNRVTDSQNITTGTWTVGGNTTLTANTTEVTDPAGGNTATKIALAANAYCSRAQQVVLSANTTYTFSFWIRGTTGSGPRAFESGGGDLTCTPSTFTYTNTGWTRVQTTFTTGATLTTIFVYVCSKSTSVGSSDVLYVWGAQLELGSGASSYIPTGASQGTRAEDGVVLSNLSGIAFNQSAGTMYSQLEIVEKLRGSFIPYGSFDTSGGGRCWWWFRHNHDTGAGQRILGNAFNSGGTAAITSSNYTHSSGVFKFATSLDPVAGRMVYAIAGGSAQVTSASGFTLATAAQMSLNKNSDVTATDLGSMWIRTIKYWPTALPDATLKSITT